MDKKQKISKHIVDMIVEDISDRGGIGNEWDAIDSTIQKEIKQAWRKIIEESITE